jgi:hypothetical protein
MASEDVFKALDVLSNNFDRLAENRDVIARMFTSRHWTKIAPLLKEMGGNTREWVEELTTGRDVAEDFEKQLNSLENQLKLLNNAWAEAKSGAYDTFKDIQSVIIPIVIQIVEGIGNLDSAMGGAATTSGLFAISLTALAISFKAMGAAMAFIGVGSLAAFSLLTVPVAAVGAFVGLLVNDYVKMAKQQDLILEQEYERVKLAKQANKEQEDLIKKIDIQKSLMEKMNANNLMTSFRSSLDIIDEAIEKTGYLKTILEKTGGTKSPFESLIGKVSEGFAPTFSSEQTSQEIDKYKSYIKQIDEQLSAEKEVIDSYKGHWGGFKATFTVGYVEALKKYNQLLEAKKNFETIINELDVSPFLEEAKWLEGVANLTASIETNIEDLVNAYNEFDTEMASAWRGVIFKDMNEWINTFSQYMPNTLQGILGYFDEISEKITHMDTLELIQSSDSVSMMPKIEALLLARETSIRRLEEASGRDVGVNPEAIKIKDAEIAAAEKSLELSEKALENITRFLIKKHQEKDITKTLSDYQTISLNKLKEMQQMDILLTLSGKQKLDTEREILNNKLKELEIDELSYQILLNKKQAMINTHGVDEFGEIKVTSTDETEVKRIEKEWNDVKIALENAGKSADEIRKIKEDIYKNSQDTLKYERDLNSVLLDRQSIGANRLTQMQLEEEQIRKSLEDRVKELGVLNDGGVKLRNDVEYQKLLNELKQKGFDIDRYEKDLKLSISDLTYQISETLKGDLTSQQIGLELMKKRLRTKVDELPIDINLNNLNHDTLRYIEESNLELEDKKALLELIKPLVDEENKAIKEQLKTYQEMYGLINSMTTGSFSFSPDTNKITDWLKKTKGEDGKVTVGSLEGTVQTLAFITQQTMNVMNRIGQQQISQANHELRMLEMRGQLITNEEDLARHNEMVIDRRIEIMRMEQAQAGRQAMTSGVMQGAMAGLATGNPLGVLAGAGLGLLGGLITGGEQKRQLEMQERELIEQEHIRKLLEIQNKIMIENNKSMQKLANDFTNLGSKIAESLVDKSIIEKGVTSEKGLADVGKTLSVQSLLGQLAMHSRISGDAATAYTTKTMLPELEKLGFTPNNETMAEFISRVKSHYDKELSAIGHSYDSVTWSNHEIIKSKLQGDIDIWQNHIKMLESTKKELQAAYFGFGIKEVLGKDGKTIIGYALGEWEKYGEGLGKILEDAKGNITNFSQFTAGLFTEGFSNIFVKENNKIASSMNNLKSLFEDLGKQSAIWGWGNVSNRRSRLTESPLMTTLKNIVEYSKEIEQEQENINRQTSILNTQWIKAGGKISDIKDSLLPGLYSEMTNILSASSYEEGIDGIGDYIANMLSDRQIENVLNDRFSSQIAKLNSTLFDAQGNVSLASAQGMMAETRALAISMEGERNRIQALRDMIASPANIEYSGVNENITYSTGSTQQVVNNYYQSLTTNIDTFFGMDDTSAYQLASVLAPHMEQVMAKR